MLTASNMRIIFLSIVICSLIAVTITTSALPVTESLSNNDESIVLTRSSFPAKHQARTLLDNILNHHHWMPIQIEHSKSMLAWMVHPMRSDAAPAIVLKNRRTETSEWLRVIGDQLATEGYVVIVPDELSAIDHSGDIRLLTTDSLTSAEREKRELATFRALGLNSFNSINAEEAQYNQHNISGANADNSSAHLIQQEASQNPHHHNASINHTMPLTEIEVDETLNLMTVEVNESRRTFELIESEWPVIVRYINAQTGNDTARVLFTPSEQAGFVMGQTPARSGIPTTGRAYEIGVKHPDLPADYYAAEEVLLDSALQSEWVNIPLENSATELSTYIVYPEGNEPTGVVIVMHHGVGLDDWQRALANQIAEDGFIAVAADTWSGTGPNGGNWDSSEFIDEAMRAAAGKISPEEAMRRYKAARDYALTLPRANGKTASVGFCMGGGFSFRFATEVPDLNAAVVFYGGSPDETAMANIQAPVLGFYGENDARVTAAVEPTQEAMERLGKYYEPHIYPDTTHSFVLFQQLGSNWAAVQDSWPRMIEFFEENLL